MATERNARREAIRRAGEALAEALGTSRAELARIIWAEGFADGDTEPIDAATLRSRARVCGRPPAGVA